VARSLRAAFSSCHLVGVDYWAGSSGLHHEVFDDIWLKPSWDLLEEEPQRPGVGDPAAHPGAALAVRARVVFHEVTIVQVTSSVARIYDPTDAVWLDPGVRDGHGSHVAVRSEAPVAVTWGAHRLAHGQWTQIGPMPQSRPPVHDRVRATALHALGQRARRAAAFHAAAIGQTFFVESPRVGCVALLVLAVAAPRLVLSGLAVSIIARLVAERAGAPRDFLVTGLVELNGWFLGWRARRSLRRAPGSRSRSSPAGRWSPRHRS
jgi:hypothetical protein